MAVAFARAFTCFGMKPKGFADRTSEKIHIGSITILDFFIPLELEQREREKAEHLTVKSRLDKYEYVYESFESYGFLLKRKVLFEKFAMDNAQKVESEWICRKGSLEFQQ
ncbi:hypothetical protein TNCT_315991 [Trichonephila clavata]|uniref:Uncharacterized protein n=1 Tax=Trichonephila clavata TaxID=2740835 RepID=A0A8X6M2L3_TRICU|nr:hypothetical protein TNCT_315991 [Trichonephila clavata]